MLNSENHEFLILRYLGVYCKGKVRTARRQLRLLCNALILAFVNKQLDCMNVLFDNPL